MAISLPEDLFFEDSEDEGGAHGSAFPEFIDGGEWTVVEDGDPHTDLSRREMRVPLGQDEEDRLARDFELLRVRFTNEKKLTAAKRRYGNPPKQYIDKAERIRLQEIVRQRFPNRPGSVCERVMERSVLGDTEAFKTEFIRSPEKAAVRAVETIGTKEVGLARGLMMETHQAVHEEYLKHMEKPRTLANARIEAQLNRLMQRLAEARMGYDQVRYELMEARYDADGCPAQAVTVRMAKLIHAINERERERQRREAERVRNERLKERAVRTGNKAKAQKIQAATDADELTKQFESYYGTTPDLTDSKRPPEWGDMEIVKPERSRPIPQKLRSPKYRANDQGLFPRDLRRLHTDSRVFAHKRKRTGGGAVVIDLSGSMSLTPEQVTHIMAALPASIIAGYSGRGGKGELRILAYKGRRVRDEEIGPFYGGNEVDGPALDWLAKQPGPRIWVSDGGVCTDRDSRTMGLVNYCANVMRKAGIVRCENANSALAHIAKNC